MNSMRRKAVQYQYVVRPPRALFDVMTRSQDKQRKMTPATGVLGPLPMVGYLSISVPVFILLWGVI
jgi:ABC-type anion transport system duplicated permease subunit